MNSKNYYTGYGRNVNIALKYSLTSFVTLLFKLNETNSNVEKAFSVKYLEVLVHSRRSTRHNNTDGEQKNTGANIC